MSGLSLEQQAVADHNSAELARHWQQVADHQREIIHQAHALLDSAGVPRVQPNPTNANDLIQRVRLLVEHDQEQQADLTKIATVCASGRWADPDPVQAVQDLLTEFRATEQRIDRLRAVLEVYAEKGYTLAKKALEADK